MKRSKLTLRKRILMVILFAIVVLPSIACEGGDAMDLTCAADPYSSHCDAW